MKIFSSSEKMSRVFVLAAALVGCSFSAPPSAKADTSLRADGTMLVNNQPFFPFGFYHVSYGYSKAARLDDMDTMANAGFNCIFTPIDLADGDVFTKATARGMGVFVEYNDPNETIETQTNSWKTQPNLLGWAAFDDIDNGLKTPSQIAGVNAQIKALDPNHLTYGSGGFVRPDSQTPPRHDFIGNYLNTSDLIALQNYPIPTDGLQACSNTFNDFFALGAANVPAKKALIANCQTARLINGTTRLRAPNALELRNMTYQAYINGMKGILFYTFYDHPNGMTPWKITDSANSVMWNEMQLLAQENIALRNILLNGQFFRKIDTGPQRFNVTCSGWAYNGKFYVMLANLTGGAKTLNFTLPAGTSGSLTPFFSVSTHNPDGLSFNAATRTITGSIGNKQVHVYSLDYTL